MLFFAPCFVVFFAFLAIKKAAILILPLQSVDILLFNRYFVTILALGITGASSVLLLLVNRFRRWDCRRLWVCRRCLECCRCRLFSVF